MISGNSVILQIGKESTYGTAGTCTQQIQISSESMKEVYNKITEGLATGGRGSGKLQTMGIGVEGSFSTLFRPDMGLILKAALGAEAVASSTEGHKHTFTAIGTGESDTLPSITTAVDRKAGKFAYVGGKIDSLSLSADKGNFMSCEVSIVGKQENVVSSLADLSPSALKAFAFAGGKFYIDNTEIADVDSASLTLNNNLSKQVQTSSTGYYYKEPKQGTREISASLSLIYSSSAESIRAAKYKSDATFALKLEFTSDEKITSTEAYKMVITIPCCQMDDATANMGGLDTLPMSISVKAVDNLSDELIKIELYNADESAY